MPVRKVAWWSDAAPHRASYDMACAFHKAGWPMVRMSDFDKVESADLNAVYGILHGMEPIIRACEAAGRDYLYIDHGYFGRSSSPTAMDGYYRVVKNELQHTVMDEPRISAAGLLRLDKMGVRLKQRRRARDGEVILLLPPSEHQCRFYAAQGVPPQDEWIAQWKLALEHKHRRTVVVCKKGDGNLENSLDIAALAVGFNSTAMIDLAAKGVLVESVGPSPLFWLPSWMPKRQWEDRRQALFCELALRQFTLDEIAQGMAG